LSSNKNKYFEVTITKIVRANNKTNALTAASVRKPLPEAKVLAESSTVQNISSADAHYFVGEMV